MGRKRGGANCLGVQSRKGKGTSTTRAASLLLGLTGGQGQVGSKEALLPQSPGRGWPPSRALPGLKLAVNQRSLAGEASDPPPCAFLHYSFLLLDSVLVPSDLRLSPRVAFPLRSSSPSCPISLGSPCASTRMVVFQCLLVLEETRKRSKEQ